MPIVGLRGSVRVTGVTELIRHDLHDVTAIRAGLIKIGLSQFKHVEPIHNSVTLGRLYVFMDSECACLSTVYVSHHQAMYVIKQGK